MGVACAMDGRVLPLWWQWPFALALWRGQLNVWGARLRLAAGRTQRPSPLEMAAAWRRGLARPGLTGPWAGTRAGGETVDTSNADHDTDLLFSFTATWVMIFNVVRSLLLDPGGLGRVPPPEVSSDSEREAHSHREVR